MPSRDRKRLMILGWLAATGAATLIAGCSDDASCAETATCPPSTREDASDAPRDTSSTKDALAPDYGSFIDGSDGAVGDRWSGDAALDTRFDVAADNRLDVGGPDGAKPDGQIPDSTTTIVDGSRTADVTADSTDGASHPNDDVNAPPDITDAGSNPTDASFDSGNAPDVAPPPDVASDTMDACPLNACGGCAPLAATPGTTCGQCGSYVCAADKESVTCSDPGYVKYKSVAVGGFSTCALRTSGGVRCWGAGQNPSAPDLAPPAQDFLTSVDAIATSWYDSCAVMMSGGLRCWGSNNTGQLGNGSTDDSWTAPASDILSAVKSVAPGDGYTCALTATGGVRCWGANFLYQLGNGMSDERHDPPVVDAIADVQAIAAHTYYTCALTTSGGVRCWGSFNGESGNGAIATPPTVDLFSGAKAISAGLYHACALMMNGDVRCWGDNRYGQLGDGTTTNHPNAPTAAVLGGVQAISVGRMHTCALMLDGDVRCWGGNYDGQLGDGTTTNRADPLGAPEVLTGVTMLAPSGADHTCALLATGRLRCWGSNNYGQVGAGDRAAHPTPADVRGVSLVLGSRDTPPQGCCPGTLTVTFHPNG